MDSTVDLKLLVLESQMPLSKPCEKVFSEAQQYTKTAT